jgi:hypothetical protein
VLDASVTNTIRLRSEAVWVDVAAFERAVHSGDAETARALFTAELLPAFYEEWILTERERLNEIASSLTFPVKTSPEAASPSAPPLPLREAGGGESPSRLGGGKNTGGNIPLYLTRFFGRKAERARAAVLLNDATCRLVTLTGVGGQGKMRLATELAQEAQQTRPVWFVRLADLWDGTKLWEAVRDALGVPHTATGAAREQVETFLGSVGHWRGRGSDPCSVAKNSPPHSGILIRN